MIQNIKTCFLLISLASLFACVTPTPEPPSEAQNLQRSVIENPNDPVILAKLGDYHIKLSKAGDAKTNVYKALDYYNRALFILPNHVALKLTIYDLYYRLAVHGSKSSQLALEKIFLELPASVLVQVNPPHFAKYLFNERIRAVKGASPLTDGHELLLKSYKETPKNIAVNVLLANSFAERGALDMAIAILSKTNNSHPENGSVLKALGTSYLDRAAILGCSLENVSDIKKSANLLKMAVTALPDDAGAHEMLADAYKRLSVIPLSLREAEIANKLAPDPFLQLLLADLQRRMGRTSDARNALEILISKDFLPALFDLAYIEASEGNWREAQGLTKDILSKDKELSFYNFLFIRVTAIKSNIDDYSLEQFELDIGTLELTDWEQQLADYWVGKLTGDKLLSHATNTCQRTEANFYIGIQINPISNRSAAKRYFQKVVDENVHVFTEYLIAKGLLSRLEKSTL